MSAPSLDSILNDPTVIGGLTKEAIISRAGDAARVQAMLVCAASSIAAAAPEHDGLLTPEQAAEYLRVPETWLRDKARAKIVKSTKLGLYVRFRREDLDALARKGCD